MHSSLVIGGTFDHFHAGHQKLLTMAFSLSKHVVLGLTQKEMNEKKILKDSMLSYEERKREIERYVQSIGRFTDLEIIPIHDVYGTTLEDKSLEAIVVTEHSSQGAKHVNERREKEGLPLLQVYTCELFSDEMGNVLSSTRIRQGLVNRSGLVYSKFFFKNAHYFR